MRCSFKNNIIWNGNVDFTIPLFRAKEIYFLSFVLSSFFWWRHSVPVQLYITPLASLSHFLTFTFLHFLYETSLKAGNKNSISQFFFLFLLNYQSCGREQDGASILQQNAALKRDFICFNVIQWDSSFVSRDPLVLQTSKYLPAQTHLFVCSHLERSRMKYCKILFDLHVGV